MSISSKKCQSGKPATRSRQFIFSCAVALAMVLTSSARAGTNSVSDALQAGVSSYVQAAVAAKGGNLPVVASTLNDVQDLLNEAKANLASVPELDPVKVGKKIDAAIKKLTGLQAYFANGSGNSVSQVKKLASAAKSLQKLANTAGTPMLVEVGAKTAGFHKVGDLVPMAFAIPDGCTDWNIQHTDSESGVVADFTVDRATGEILVTMGSVGGSARVTVTGCGLPPEGKSWFLYNYGPKPIAGLPDGFPTNLANGDYAMSYSGNVTCNPGGGYSIPSMVIGTYPFSGNLKGFYTQFKAAMDAAVASVSQPGCTQSVSYSPFTGGSFNCTLTVTCTTCSSGGCVTCTSRLVFTFTKL